MKKKKRPCHGQVAQGAQLTVCIPWWSSKMSAKFSNLGKKKGLQCGPFLPPGSRHPANRPTVSLFSGSCHLAAPVGFSETHGGCGLYYESSPRSSSSGNAFEGDIPVHSHAPLLCGSEHRLTDKEGYDFCPGEALWSTWKQEKQK